MLNEARNNLQMDNLSGENGKYNLLSAQKENRNVLDLILISSFRNLKRIFLKLMFIM